jgi:type I restriction-modification system DNA methylase subunit
MDALEFKEYILGVLLLKRCSDQREERYEQVLQRGLERKLPRKGAERRADHPNAAALRPARSVDT